MSQKTRSVSVVSRTLVQAVALFAGLFAALGGSESSAQDTGRVGEAGFTMIDFYGNYQARFGTYGLAQTPFGVLGGPVAPQKPARMEQQGWLVARFRAGLQTVGHPRIEHDTSYDPANPNEPGRSLGFPLNVDIFRPPATPNYLPLHQDAAMSTAAFVSERVETEFRPLFLADRRVVAGVVDPMSGQPLLKDTDLELPVGRAMFRLIRTYGGDGTGTQGLNTEATFDQTQSLLAQAGLQRFWDWAGTGWMSSENPILLFHARNQDGRLPAMCQLLLDAHHSIPFTQDRASGSYVSPTWFDAVMTTKGGTWNAARGDWDTLPDRVAIRLYGGSVTYTFALQTNASDPRGKDHPVYKGADVVIGNSRRSPNAGDPWILEDTRILEDTNAPCNPVKLEDGSGGGAPVYGLLESIEDGYNNKAVFTYVPRGQGVAKPRVSIVERGGVSTTHMVEDYYSKSTEVGQIQSIKLLANDIVQWTLLYVYRDFRAWAPDWDDFLEKVGLPRGSPRAGAEFDEWHGLCTGSDTNSRWLLQKMLHAVYVYKGNTTQLPRHNTVPAEAFVFKDIPPASPPPELSKTGNLRRENWINSLNEQEDKVNQPDWENTLLGPQAELHDWTYRIRYTHDEIFRPTKLGPGGVGVFRGQSDQLSSGDTVFGWGSYWNDDASQGAPQRDMPGIFAWGTAIAPDPMPASQTEPYRIAAGWRLVPNLLKVQVTKRDESSASGGSGGPATPQASSTTTGYVYASQYGKPSAWAKERFYSLPNNNDIRYYQPGALNVVYSNDTPSIYIDANQRMVPCLRHVLYDEKWSALTSQQGPFGQEGRNAPFNPSILTGSVSGGGVAGNTNSWDSQSDLSFEWTPFPRALAESIDVRGTGTTGNGDGDLNYKTRIPDNIARSPWLRQLVTGGSDGDCVLNKIKNTNTILSARERVVSAVRIQQNNPTLDGWHEIMYFSVSPHQMPDLPQGWYVRAETDKFNAVGGGASTLSPDPDPELAFRNPGPIRHLFPYLVHPKAPGQRKCEYEIETQMESPAWLALVDRHDGRESSTSASRRGLATRRAYSMRYLAGIGLPGRTPSGGSDDLDMKPHQRELVALNPAGFVCWSRSWDYEGGKASADGPTEEFIYESTQSKSPVGSAVTWSVENPPDLLRLKEHRSFGWGVAQTRNSNNQPLGCFDANDPNPPQTLGNTRGLITTYTYRDGESAGQTIRTGLVAEVAVKEGLLGTPVKVSTITYSSDINDPIPTGSRKWRYTSPQGGLEQTQETGVSVEYWPPLSTDTDPSQRRVKVVTTWQQALPAGPGALAGTRLHPFESKHYSAPTEPSASAGADDRSPGGVLLARSYGLAQSLASIGSGTHDLVFVDRYRYDALGRMVLQVVDYDQSGPGAPPSWTAFAAPSGRATALVRELRADEVLPPGFVRKVPAGSGAIGVGLNRYTGYAYDPETSELRHLAKPDGRHDFYMIAGVDENQQHPTLGRYELRSIRIRANFIDGEVVRNPGQDSYTSTLEFPRPGQLSVSLGGRLRNAWSVKWHDNTITGGLPSFEYEQPVSIAHEFLPNQSSLVVPPGFVLERGTLLSRVNPEFDSAGRVTKTSIAGEDTEALSRISGFTDFGGLTKQIDPSGTYRRMVTNPFGRVLSEFVGTSDNDSCWSISSGPADNMLLTHRHFYGEGINDIFQRTLTYRYRRNLYKCDDVRYDGTSSNSDRFDWSEERLFDRRMRPVGTIINEGSVQGTSFVSNPLRAELTWLDHLGRKRFVGTFDARSAAGTSQGTFGSLLASSVNPSTRDVYTLGDPTASQVLAFAPLQLTEYTYNDRGDVESEREYDCTSTTSPKYRLTQTYYDHNGRVRWRAQPDGRVERIVYDALGRMAESATLRGDDLAYELESSRNQFHENGNIEVASRRVRTLKDQSLALSATNAVSTDVVNWYDDNNRVIATASLGTGSSTRSFSNDVGTLAIVPPSRVGSAWKNPPTFVPGTGSAALVEPGSWTSANSAGVNARLARASVTRTDYDSQGRVFRTTGNRGEVTQRRYDVYNRVVEERVAPSADKLYAVEARVTASKYTNGQLAQIAHTRGDHPRLEKPDLWDGPGKGAPDEGPVNLDVVTKSRQLTTLVYGAAVVSDDLNGSYSEQSISNELLRGIRFEQGLSPCDANGNGTTDVNDIFAFLAVWFARLPAGDFNRDGRWDISDYNAFLACWFANNGKTTRTWAIQNNVGRPGETGYDIQFRYTLDGLPAWRKDLSESTMLSRYDVLGRRVETRVLPKAGLDRTLAPSDMIERSTYAYDLLGRLTGVSAFAKDENASEYIVSSQLFQHDTWGNLTRDIFAHGRQASAGSTTQAARGDSTYYTWETLANPAAPVPERSSAIYTRLDGISYPVRPGDPALGAGYTPAPVTSLYLGYGPAASASGPSSPSTLDSILNRVQRVMVSNAGLAPGPRAIVAYDYIGTSMRAGQRFGPGTLIGFGGLDAIVQSFVSPTNPLATQASSAAPGFDDFGRVRDLHYMSYADPAVNFDPSDQNPVLGAQPLTTGTGSPTLFNPELATLWRGEYAYDNAGNRASEKQTVSTPSRNSAAYAQSREWSYAYDAQNRLVSADARTFNPLDTGAPVNLRFSQKWSLDELGNWGSGPSGPGLIERSFAGNVGFDPLPTLASNMGGLLITQTVNPRQELATIKSSFGNTPVPAPPGAVTEVKHVYDNSGRLMSDGTYFYERDFFGRLVQVRRLSGGANTAPTIDPVTGAVTGLAKVGAVVAHYTYDGLGRVVRVQRPENALSTSYTATDLFYDGVRCVQEAGWVRVPARTVQATQANALGNGGATDGSGGAGALILTTLYIHKLPQRASYFAQDGTGTGTNTTTAVPNVLGMRRLEREYVYAMDPGAYVDEVVAQLVYTDAHRATGPPAGLGGAGGDDGGAEIEEIPGSNSSQSLVTPAGEFGDDRTPTLVYVLTDSNQNVVGLADSGGRLVASYEYSPYGVVEGARYFAADSSLISQEARAAARTSRLGHQGLRFERFDRPWRGGVSNATTDVPGAGTTAVVGAVFEPEYADIGPGTPSSATLALADGLPGYDGVYHNRNRMYDPENGRFIEVDPRGLGLPVLDDFSYNGTGFTPVDVVPDLAAHFSDGIGAHVSYLGKPMLYRDPSGLGIVNAVVSSFLGNTIIQGIAFSGGLIAAQAYYYGSLQGGTPPNVASAALWAVRQNLVKRTATSIGLGAVPYSLGTLANGVFSSSPISQITNIARGGIGAFLAYASGGSGLYGNSRRIARLGGEGSGGVIGTAAVFVFLAAGYSAAIESEIYTNYAEQGKRGDDLLNAVGEY